MKTFAAHVLLVFLAAATASQTPSPTPTPISGINEEVTVTANRTETAIGDTPASVATFSTLKIETSAAPTVDDILRQSVGFSIFRRSSSRNANPTTQGVSLRGVGASGASRSVVMYDNVPLNDPFGGWVQWNRVSPVEVERIEVLRGGASGLYGDAALSGAVNILPETEHEFYLPIDLSFGTQKTFSPSGYWGFALGSRWHVDLVGAAFQSRGYVPLDPVMRGPVDSFAGMRSGNYKARVTRTFRGGGRVFFSPTYFGEVRTNGTRLQVNRTHIRQFIAGGDLPRVAEFKWRIWTGTQVYDQTFSTINTARTTETLNRIQRVPAQNLGVSAQFSQVFGRHQLIGGVDAKNVRGTSDEIAIANNQPTSLIGAGGRQTTFGLFLRDFVKLGDRVVIAGTLRGDHWSNYRASSMTRTLAIREVLIVNFPDRTENALSPQISVLFHANDMVSVYANASRNFRAPTLNELYRSFRVGNVMTLYNENLRAERATDVEGGINVGRNKTRLRANVFWTAIDGPVANVTISATQTLINRQRQNAGSTRAAGIEIEGEIPVYKQLQVSAGYMFVDPIVTSFPTNPALVGLTVPQVARHQFTLQARYKTGRWALASQLRASASQFDDDLNQFRLERFAQVDVFGSWRIKGEFEIYAAAENIFNSRYSIAKTPIRSVSPPAAMRVGFRWK